jgi:hypothetical protein
VTLVRRALAALLLCTALVAVLVAHDVGKWRSALRTGDATFATHPLAARWRAAPAVLGDPAQHVVSSDGYRFRRAARGYDVVKALGQGSDSGLSEASTRGLEESSLSGSTRGRDPVQASEAANLLGILAFADATPTNGALPAPVERSTGDFVAAVHLDPSNADAKFNLELLLQLLVEHGKGPTNASSATLVRGKHGASGSPPGTGY